MFKNLRPEREADGWGPKVVLLSVFLIFLLMPKTSAKEMTEEQVRKKLEEMGEEHLLMFFEPGEILITSSARRPQPIKRASSAMYVITAEDIRQAGVTHIADLFRLVPVWKWRMLRVASLQ